MDTTWFAIDRDGHVAVFDSGEAGAVPTEGYNDKWGRILEELVKAAGGKSVDDDVNDWEDLPARLAELGYYSYRHDEWENAIAGPYDRVAAPETPLPGAQVPRGILAEMVAFDGRFADTPRLQPCEHWPSDAWSAAWIATDGESVHCIPGHEDEYAAEIEQLDAELADGRALKIDPPTVAAKPKAPPSARALPAKRWWQFWKK